MSSLQLPGNNNFTKVTWSSTSPSTIHHIFQASGCSKEGGFFSVSSTLRSLRRRRNLSPVSNVCEAAKRSLFWTPNGLNEQADVRFQFPFNLIGYYQSCRTIVFLNRPIMARKQILVRCWGPRTRISALVRRRT